MRVRDHLKLQIKVGATWTDFSDGLISADILRGIQSAYEGPWQQCEAGVLTLVTRNPNLDPYQNSNIRMNRDIRIVEADDLSPIFSGRISGINVDYQAKGKPPIITMNAVDMVGTMALHTLRDTFKDRLGSTMGLVGMFQELEMASTEGPTTSEIIGFVNPYRSATGSGNAVTASSGTTALAMATKLGQGAQAFFYADKANDMYLYPSIKQKKDDAIKLQFDSRGGATSYTDIILSDGFDLLKNQLSINASGNIIPLYYNTYSVNQWGAQKATVDTFLVSTTPPTQNETMNTYASNVFKETVNPTREIQSITFDATKCPDDAHDIDILDNVYIYHEVDGFDISRKYGIIGIHHVITENSWDITYNLRNMFVYETSYTAPIIAATPSNGTIDTVFTFSISNASQLLTEGASYYWTFGDGTTSTLASPTHQYSISYVGTRNVQLTFTNSYGFVFTSNIIPLVVAGAAPSGVSFTYTVSSPDTSIINFEGAIATNAVNYSWDFGDGTTGIGRYLSHKYSTSGNKTVVLSVSNAYGTTTSTQTINVTVPAGPTNELGTMGVRYIKLAMPPHSVATGYYYPGMYHLKALTSYTNTDRGAAQRTKYSSKYGVPGEIPGTFNWERAQDHVDASMSEQGLVNNSFLRADNNLGLVANQTVTGTANWGLVIDLTQIYYDIKKFTMEFSGTFQSGQPLSIDVYVSPYTADFPATYAEAQTLYDTMAWVKAGTISRSTGTFTPIITMPANI